MFFPGLIGHFCLRLGNIPLSGCTTVCLGCDGLIDWPTVATSEEGEQRAEQRGTSDHQALPGPPGSRLCSPPPPCSPEDIRPLEISLTSHEPPWNDNTMKIKTQKGLSVMKLSSKPLPHSKITFSQFFRTGSQPAVESAGNPADGALKMALRPWRVIQSWAWWRCECVFRQATRSSALFQAPFKHGQ